VTCARALALLCLTASGGVARAYDFEIDARTTGQGYQVRWVLPSTGDLLLDVRRITQSLDLHIWNILEPRADPGYPDSPRKKAPFDLYFTSSLRLDHDFGSFTNGLAFQRDFDRNGELTDTRVVSAQSLFPELGDRSMDLDLLWAYLGGRGLLGGRLSFELGRQLFVDTLDWFALDGAHVRYLVHPHVALEALGGLVVRDQSFLGGAMNEPDGTGSAECTVWGDVGGGTIGVKPVEGCPQRSPLMPTYGFSISTVGFRSFEAKLSYRRSESPTALPASGESPYQNTLGQAPAWGVDEERAVLSLRANLLHGGIVPWANARWSFLLDRFDEAELGARLGWPTVSVSPSVAYSFPSFDGDSIFNVFSASPYTDARATIEVRPRPTIRLYLRGFYRIFANEDGLSSTLPGEAIDTSTTAAGVSSGAAFPLTRRGAARVDLYYEDGFGGLRAGGDASARMHLLKMLDAEARVSLVRFREDLIGQLYGTSFGAQGGALVQLGEGIGLHFLAEENANRIDTSQFRLMAVLDLSFHPEP
jgi:hypothetical protein